MAFRNLARVWRLQTHFYRRNLLSSSSCNVRKLSTSNSAPRNDDEYDVIVAGGGMVGAAVACGLAQSPILNDKRILILEGGDPKIFDTPPTTYSNRVSAVNPGSRDFLDQIGVWSSIKSMRLQAVKRMQIWESCSDSFITYQQPNLTHDVTYIIENNIIISALFQRLQQFGDRVTVFKKSRVSNYNLPGNQNSPVIPLVTVNLEDGRKLKTKLLVGADGIRSMVRETMKAQYIKWEYQQNAVVATLELAEPTSNIVAWQRFLPTGPIALLPLNDKMSSLVWTNTPENCNQLMDLNDECFIDAINSAFWSSTEKINVVESSNKFLNELLNFISPNSIRVRQFPPSVQSVEKGSRASFPLGLGHSVNYVATRVALVGDAAHRVHPLAGLGVNLGFADARELVQVISESCYQGDEIGLLSHLLKYETSRQRSVVPIMAGVDALNRLYSTKFLPLVLLRSLGLQLTDACQPLKDQIMHHASY